MGTRIEPTTVISIYATAVSTGAMPGETLLVRLEGVDAGNIAAEFNTHELLDTMELSDVHDYVMEKLKESKEEEEDESLSKDRA